MRFEYIVLLIIAFNVISAVAQRRAKKARDAEAARQGSPGPASGGEKWDDDEDQRAGTGEEERIEKMPSLGRDILDQLARDLGLKVPKPQAPQRPRPAVSVPASAPVRTESPEEVRERLRRRERELEVERARAREKIREWERLAASGTRGATSSSSAAHPVAAPSLKTARASAPMPAAFHGDAVKRPDLRDPRRLREAFIAKEILDAPLSRRTRR